MPKKSNPPNINLENPIIS